MTVTGLAPVCCCAALRQSFLVVVVSLMVSLGICIVGGVARPLDRTTSHTQKLKSFWPGPRIRSPVPVEEKISKGRLEEPQIPSLESLLEKPEDSDPETETQEEKESVRRNSGKPSEFHWSKRGMCVHKKAHWPARYRSITRVGDRPALRADAPTQRGVRTLQPSARASRREGAYFYMLDGYGYSCG